MVLNSSSFSPYCRICCSRHYGNSLSLPYFTCTFQAVPFEKFPYMIIYAIEPGHIHIVAVAHTKRKPGYWLIRIKNTEETPPEWRRAIKSFYTDYWRLTNFERLYLLLYLIFFCVHLFWALFLIGILPLFIFQKLPWVKEISSHVRGADMRSISGPGLPASNTGMRSISGPQLPAGG